MNRRELLKAISALTGTAMIGGGALLSGCAQQQAAESVPPVMRFSPSDVELLDEIAETLLPRTDVPGAKDADTGRQMSVMVNNCYTEEDQGIFHRGLADLQSRSATQYGVGFMELTPQQRHEFLTLLDEEAKRSVGSGESETHYFTMIKQLTLFCFFTSEVAATQAMRFIAVPGRYDGCAPYEPGQPAWASS